MKPFEAPERLKVFMHILKDSEAGRFQPGLGVFIDIMCSQVGQDGRLIVDTATLRQREYERAITAAQSERERHRGM